MNVRLKTAVHSPAPSRRGLGGTTHGSQGRHQHLFAAASFQLLDESPGFVKQHDPRHSLQEGPVFLRHLLSATHENAAGFIDQRRFRAGGDDVHNRVLQRLAVNRVVLIPDHEVARQPLHPPVGVGLHGLPHQIEPHRVADADEHDRQVSGDSVAPQSRLSPSIAG